MSVNVSTPDSAPSPPQAQTTQQPRTADSFTCVFTGGGTGGHVYPALAIADEMRKRNPEARIVYIGARGRIETTLVPQRGYPIHRIRACGLPTRKRPAALLSFALRTGVGTLQSIVHLLRVRPDVVVATGGYVSGPVLLAWALLRFLRLSAARSFIHEQNAVPGRVNRLAGRFVDRIGVSFAQSLRYFPADKVVQVGYPVRREMASIGRIEAREELGIPPDAGVVFVFGGSQGSRSINRGVADALPALMAKPQLYVIHVIGRQHGPEYDAAVDTAGRIARAGLDPAALPRYRRIDYAHHIQKLYAASDLVIGRGGAATITEVCACARPSIIIPLSNTPGDHQAINARMLETAGAGRVLYEEAVLEGGRIVRAVTGRRLSAMILELLDAPERLAEMTEQARTLFDGAGLDRIMMQLDHLKQGRASSHDKPADGPARRNGAGEAPASYSPLQLLRLVERRPDDRHIRGPGRDYLRYKVDCYLTDARWQIRNIGVKLVGLLNCRDKAPLLLAMLLDRTPASRLHRVFGGDYRQVGFIRRNIVSALTRLGTYDADVRAALLTALADPYYEVRSAAARAFATLARPAEAAGEVTEGLRSLLKDSSFEVIAAAVTALGKIGGADTLADLRPFYLHGNWKVREAVIHAMIDLLERDVGVDPETLNNDLENILITCVDFQPAFPIKRALNDLARRIEHRRQRDVSCSTTSPSISTIR